jgi:hypothetical protein
MSVASFALWQQRRLSKECVERPWRYLSTEYAHYYVQLCVVCVVWPRAGSCLTGKAGSAVRQEDLRHVVPCQTKSTLVW